MRRGRGTCHIHIVMKAYTRYGMDFVRVQVGDRFVDAPVALAAPLADTQGQFEVLSGLRPGDRIELPES